MKKLFIVIVLLLLCSVSAFSDPANPDTILLQQPDGTLIWTRIHGDELYHWRSTTDGNVIIQDEQQRYCYAVVESDSIYSSNIFVHNVFERTVEEKMFIANKTKEIQQFIRAEQQKANAKKQYSMQLERQEDYYAVPQTTNAVVGKRKLLTILMGFKDRPFTKTIADFDSLMNQKSGKVDYNLGSVWKFYNEDSYGKLDVSAIVVGPFVARNQSAYYKYDKTNDIEHVEELVLEAIEYARRIVDLSNFDWDNDGNIDGIHIVFAGTGLSSGAADGLIWPHKYAVVTKDGEFCKYIITPELASSDKIAPIGTICHEIGHLLGAPDFYDCEKDLFYATGDYDLMCNGEWNARGGVPAHHNAYTKCYLFGWGNPLQVAPISRSYTLSPSTINSTFYRINTSTNGEFFLLENRVLQNFDAALPLGGLLIYHIHKDLATTIAKWDNINSQHPLQCYIVGAYGTTDPTENPKSYGLHDSYRAYPGERGEKTSFTITSIPSFTAWNGAGTGVNICFIRKEKNDDITFTVNPQIEGPDQLCKEKTYSVTGVVPDKDTIVWSYSTDISSNRLFPVLKFHNGNKGSSVVVERGGQFIKIWNPRDTIPFIRDSMAILSQSLTIEQGAFDNRADGIVEPYVGTVTLRATVHSGNGIYTIEKKIELPENIQPQLNITPESGTLWIANTMRTFTEIGCPNVEDEYIKWYVTNPQDSVTHEFTGRTINVMPTKRGTLTIRVVNDCGCPTKNETTYTFSVMGGTIKPPFRFESYQNPVNTSSMSIVIERNAEENDVATFAVQDDFTNYTIELWSELQGRVRTLTSNAEHVSLDVAGLPNGWYQLLLLQDGQLLDSGNVLITH